MSTAQVDIRRVAVVGGGASGILAAHHLAEAGFSVMVIERGPLGGVAYGRPHEGCRMNVPAAKLAADPGDPEGLIRWLAAEGDHEAEPGAFIHRRRYGAYLQSLLRAGGERIDVVAGKVTACAGRSVHLADGTVLDVDAVVIAVGPSRARPPASLQDPALDPHVLTDPWDPGLPDRLALLPPRPTVVVVGTGLTGVDVALLALRRADASVVAVSRHGWLPTSVPPGSVAPIVPAPLPVPVTARRALRWFRRELERSPGAWPGVVDGLRPHTAQLWRAMPEAERARLVRLLRRRWDVHRHRLAPGVAATLETARDEGRLAVVSGGVAKATPRDDGRGLVIDLGSGSQVRADLVVSCLPPEPDIRTVPLLAALVDAGRARPGPLGLGLRTDGDGRVLDGAGRAQDDLWALGPLRLGELWETTAIPEIRTQAKALAAAMRRSVPIGGVPTTVVFS